MSIRLTPHQARIWSQIQAGATQREVAVALGCQVQTVKAAVAEVRNKLGLYGSARTQPLQRGERVQTAGGIGGRVVSGVVMRELDAFERRRFHQGAQDGGWYWLRVDGRQQAEWSSGKELRRCAEFYSGETRG